MFRQNRMIKKIIATIEDLKILRLVRFCNVYLHKWFPNNDPIIQDKRFKENN